jgi:hypothetical protein
VRKPDFFLNSAQSSTSAAHTIGNIITAVDEVLDVLTILFDYTHISSVFLSSFQYILYITKIQLNNIIITW